MSGSAGATAFAVTFVDELSAAGLVDVCVAPGSRSAPLAMAFARHPDIKVHVHIDERSCAFFALGLAKATERPVAILCTSGTAAAEFHAAVVESSHSFTPLLVLTADRPPELIDVGANQAIDQSRLYASAVRWYHDPGVPQPGPEAGVAWRRLAVRALAECVGPPAGPVHLNLPFREPLTAPVGEVVAAAGRTGAGGRLVQPAEPALPDEPGLERLRRLVAGARRPLLVAGEMRDGARLRGQVSRFAAATGAALFAEPSSQLRVMGAGGLVETYDALLRTSWGKGMRPDLVIGLGATPTSKPLNQWLASARCPTVLVDPVGAWRDPDMLADELVRCDPGGLLHALAEHGAGAGGWQRDWVHAGEGAALALAETLASAPLFEAHAVRALAKRLPDPADLLIGSSMPIRDVDTFWPAAEPGQRFLGNRGASGIDGLVSTGLGMAAARLAPAALLLGDLSLYHDMNGLWAVRRHKLRATVIVLDNNGGGIFSFLPQAEHEDVFEELFGTPLDLDLGLAAELYGLGHLDVDATDDLDAALAAALGCERSTLVRVRFSREDSVLGHRRCWEAVASAVG